MRKLLLFAVVVTGAFSCSKNAQNAISATLWPIKPGNTWIYKDSVFSDTALTTSYLDTAYIGSAKVTDASGLHYYDVHDSLGWFGTGGYVGVDPTNSTIYEWDNQSASPYIFFQTAQVDGQQVGYGTDYSNAACPLQFISYGFVTPTMINGYSCLKNIEYTVDCNNITKEAIVTLVSPGTGVVRMEDWLADSTQNNALYMDYSQTLQSAKLN